MEFMKLFLTEVTEELLYNIVYDKDEIEYHDLSDEFERKTGYQPMDFFGFGNLTGQGWFDFIRMSPGIELYCDMISIDDEDEIRANFYSQNNTTDITDDSVETVAEYREELLIDSCKIIKDHFPALNNGEDTNGNTPLHLIAALPGFADDEPTLVKYLLHAGVDPLEPNDNGQNFLHIVSGRIKAEDGAFCFDSERISTTLWHINDRIILLNLLLETLTSAQLASLAKAQDKKGNTVMHEWAISMLNVEKFKREKKIFKKLLEFGGSLRIQNNRGETALHYAFNPEVFKIFLQNGAICRARNDHDETPVLSILKTSVGLAFAETSAYKEFADLCFAKKIRNRSLEDAIEMLEGLTSLVSENEEVRKTFWIPDVEGNSAVTLILIAIRLGSYSLGTIHGCGELRTCLVELLSSILHYENTNDMKQHNNKGQSPLHVLLDMGNKNKNTLKREKHILQTVELLLKHDADVNTIDSAKRTPLDVTYKHCDKRPSLYKKCTEMFINHGARCNALSSKPTSVQTSLVQDLSKLRLSHNVNEKRKLRSCPKRHLDNAQRLTDIKSKVTIVGKYRFSCHHPIGSGAFSLIFVAIKDENVDSKTGTINCRAFALKQLQRAKMDPQEIKREITALLDISGKCENIIKCHEAVEDEFFHYLCLDLMDGDLNEFVANERVNSVLKENSAMSVQVTKEIINGVAYLHDHNFIHRDLKPGNILYTTDPTLHFKIADFGLAKNMSTLSTMTSTRGSGVAMAPGTRCWMAPELVSMKSREHTQQSDIFSLGLVLHYLLTFGKHPFTLQTEEPAHVIERRIVDMQIRLDQSLHPEASNFLQMLLREDSRTRPPAKFLHQHPFLWSERKKIEFLKAVGDQPEAVNPANHPNSALEQRLQTTPIGRQFNPLRPWNQVIKDLYEEMTRAWKQKKYRTDKVIDLIRFIRNAYAHKQERSSEIQKDLDGNIFLRVYPSLVLDAFDVVQQLGFDESRSNIKHALSL